MYTFNRKYVETMDILLLNFHIRKFWLSAHHDHSHHSCLFVYLKFFIRHNETALLKQNNKYKINKFSMFLVKTLLCT